MKKILIILTILFVSNLSAQKFKALDVSPLDISYSTNPEAPARIIYSRPQLKGRKLDGLASKGKIWRTGANETTELTLFKDMKIGGKSILEGRYSLYTIPGETEWTIILNSKLDTWGAYSYSESNDVLRVKARAYYQNESIEAFSIIMEDSENGFDIHIGWDNMRLKIPITK